MSMLPPGETIVETKKCLISGETFHVTDKDLEFYDSVSPVFGGKKYSIPSPTLCPDERARRRLGWRNERNLYHRKCDLTGKQILSLYADEDMTVYDQSVWWSDDWSPSSYSQDFSCDDLFFKQFGSLLKSVPQLALLNSRSENSEYTNHSAYNKDCYMCFNTGCSESCYYMEGYNLYCKNSIDNTNVEKSENTLGSIQSNNLTNVHYGFLSFDCRDAAYVFDCHNCHNCFGCWNLRNISYCIFNEQYNKDEYHQKVNTLLNNYTPHEMAGKFWKAISHQAIHKFAWNENNDYVIGDSLKNCKDVFSSFKMHDAQRIRYSSDGSNCSDFFDVTEPFEGTWQYETHALNRGNNMRFSSRSYECSSSLYLESCHNSQNCFGCCSLKKASHCILNKPYSKHEYETLCGKIIDHMKSTGEWGEFFPHEMSPFGYNETVAQEYFPMTEDEVASMPKFEHWRSGKYLKDGQQASGVSSSPEQTEAGSQTPEHGWNWRPEDETSSYHGEYYAPLGINSYDETKVGVEEAKRNIDSCIAGIHKCEVTGKPFKVIKQELAFYIENNIPIPTKCPDQRHKERMALRNPRKLYERKCMCPTCKSPNEPMYTTYAPDRPETVYCSNCYRDEVYV